MHYEHIGSGEPLVLIHGLGEIKEGWMNQHELANEYELIIPDIRGHGESDTTESLTIESFAKDILDLLDVLGIETAHICGFSMGGTVAQEIYRQAPERFRSLILVSTFHYAPKIIGNCFFQFRILRDNLLTPACAHETIARTCLYSWNQENLDKFTTFHKPKPEIYMKSLEACLQVDNVTLLPKISVPTLIIGCQYDAIVPLWAQILMHKSIPNSELVIFKNIGHIAKFEAAEKFNQTLRTFLKKYKEKQAG
jgi:pimeloyl-ACP methyl ester carboxylesterase